MKKTIFTLALSLFCVSPTAWSGLAEGITAYSKGDYPVALREFQLAANQGDAIAQYNLGRIYASGQGVTPDFKEATKWYRLAADQGDVVAQYDLARMYALGRGVIQNYKEAAKWYRLVADQGNDYAKFAQYELGLMYTHGQGVPQDYEEAVKWYRLVADQGHVSAQYSLGVMYSKGQGVPKSKVVSYALWNVSASNNRSNENAATRDRTTLAKMMSAKEIEAGQALTREMMKPGNLLKALDQYAKKTTADSEKTSLSIKTM